MPMPYKCNSPRSRRLSTKKRLESYWWGSDMGKSLILNDILHSGEAAKRDWRTAHIAEELLSGPVGREGERKAERVPKATRFYRRNDSKGIQAIGTVHCWACHQTDRIDQPKVWSVSLSKWIFVHIYQIVFDRNEQEFALLQEKHEKEIELYRIQLGNATKLIGQLEHSLSAYKAKR